MRGRTPTRVYIVTIGECDRLVRASHPNAALMHVVRDIAAVAVASQDELIDCLADGIKVESVKDETPEPAPAAPVDDKTLPLWPMPTPVTASAPQADDDQAEEDEDDEEISRPAQDGQTAGYDPHPLVRHAHAAPCAARLVRVPRRTVEDGPPRADLVERHSLGVGRHARAPD